MGKRNNDILMDSYIESFKNDLTIQFNSNAKEEMYENIKSKLLGSLNSVKEDLYMVQHYLFMLSHERLVDAVCRYTADLEVAANNAYQSWSLCKYHMLFREQWLYECANQFNSYEDFIEEYSINNAANYVYTAWGLSAQYYFSLEVDWEERVKLFEIASYRGDFDSEAHLPHYASQFIFLKLLYSEENSSGLVSELSQFAPFESLYDSWLDDSKFSIALDQYCNWHLEQCSRAFNGEIHCFGELSYSVLPIWIFALDKRRAVEFGKSCLPENSLIDISRNILDSLSYTDISDSEVVKKVKGIYDEKFGDSAKRLPAFWKDYCKD